MKVLFLDIDGVLNSARTVVSSGGFPHSFSKACMAKFDMTAVGLIRNLCEVAGVSVVLSSSWRILHKIEEVDQGLNLPIISKTPSLAGKRGDEIAAWLQAHPEVERYAIVDDDSDMLEEQLPYFVHTSGDEGLSFADYRKLCSIFGINEHDRPDFRMKEEIV